MHDSPIAWMMAGGIRTDEPDGARHRPSIADAALTREAEVRLPRFTIGRVRSLIAAPAGSVASPALDCCPA